VRPSDLDEEQHARKSVCRNVCETQTLGQTVIYISKYLTKEQWEKRQWAKHTRIRGINNGVLWPYTVRLKHHQNEITYCGFHWDWCGYAHTICRFFFFSSINVWECVQLNTKRGLKGLICCGLQLMVHYSWAAEYGSEMP